MTQELARAIERLLDSEQSARDYPPPTVRVGRAEYEQLRTVYLEWRDSQ